MSNHGVCQDVDVTLVGGTCFSAYGADNVTFLRTRAKNNHADGSCLDGQGYCKDSNGLWPNSQTYASDQSVPDKTCCGTEALTRCDTEGGLWLLAITPLAKLVVRTVIRPQTSASSK